MSLMLLLSSAASPVIIGVPQSPLRGDPQCPQTAAQQAAQRDRKPAPRRLDRLPAANAYSAVYRLVNGCEVPVVVRYDVGKR